MPRLSIQSLQKSFGPVHAVQDLSLEVHQGQVHGLLGPNGSGKTTSLYCALGLLRPTAGQIEILGCPSHALHQTAGRIGVVFDRPVLMKNRSVRANLQYQRMIRGHSGGRGDEEVLEMVGLSDLVSRKAGALSLGQGKRLALAMALAGKPELIILDEPLSGLDPPGTREILALIQELSQQGMTLVLSTHRLHDVESILTHATIMVQGRRVTTGPIDAILGRAEGRFRVRLQDPSRGLQLVQAQESLTLCAQEGDTLEIQLSDHQGQASDLAQLMVQSGAGLMELQPAGQRLADAFDDLVHPGVST